MAARISHAFVPGMTKEAIDRLISKKPQLRLYREKLEALEPGSFVVHRSWGVGRVTGFDEARNKLTIDFEKDKSNHEMDPAFCATKLEVLPEDNILARHRREPDEIETLITEQPADLIVEILSKSEQNQATTAEIEGQLSRLMGEKRYKKWWTATKKVLVKDPRVATPSRKTEPYVLRDEPLSADEEVLEGFYRTKNSKKKIALAEKLLEVSSSKEELVPKLPDVLKELTEVLQSTLQLTEGERLHGIWVRNDLARFLHDDVESLEPTSADLIKRQEDLNELAEEIPASYQKRLLDLLKRLYAESWKSTVFDLLRNSSGKFTNECISFLMENGCGEELDATLERWLNEQALKGPLLMWIVKNRSTRRYTKMLSKLVGPRLFSAIFYAIDYESLQNTTARRIPLADMLSDDKELIPEMLSSATPETARDLATTLLMNQGFEDLTKKSLLARFIRQFPAIQNLVAGDKEATEQPDRLIVSQASFDQRKAEYEELIQKKIPENKEAIAAARELGDLKENSEYKMARQDQEQLMALKAMLERDLGRARITDFTDAPAETVGVGSVVSLKVGSSGSTTTYTILGAWDGDPDRNILSYQTPLAQRLIGKRVGDSVTTEIDGTAETWSVESIARYVPQAQTA